MKNKKDAGCDDLLHYLLSHGDVSLYGCRIKDFPDSLLDKKIGHVRVFTKKQKENVSLPNHFSLGSYSGVLEIHYSNAEVCFLDKAAIRALFIRLPVRPRYVLVRLRPRITWVLGLPGLVRRIVKGQVEIRGVCRFRAGAKNKLWLVLKVANSKLRSNFSLSEKVGVQGLLDYLWQEKIDYVVLRFFEKLPQLQREGGDLDILVSDRGYDRLVNFLETRRGSIKLDVWSVSALQYGDTPYYPPPIARKIIESAVDGPAGSRVPAPKELFLSFAYHALYHKGEGAGIASSTPGVHVSDRSPNDYAGTLKKMAKSAGIEVDINMEAIDEYLANEGWRPRIDSLARIIGWNKWAKQRFFSEKDIKEKGLNVFILKEKALQLNLLDPILAAIKKEKFNIVRYKLLNNEEQKHVADSLRGGNWTEGKGREELFAPKAAIVVLDLHFLYNTNKGMNLNRDRSRFLKEKLRSKFDDEKMSLVHSADNTNEAWEYIRVCFPKENDAIKNSVDKLYAEFKPSFLERVRLHFRTVMYHKTIFISRIKESIIKFLTK